MMPEYRDVKKPAGLIGAKLTKDEEAIIEGGGNEAAVGTDITDAKYGSQLDMWYRDDRTIVRAARDGKTIKGWSFKGAISPHDCREWYLASIPAKKGQNDA